MRKTMTAKEFKEIMTDAGMDFSIWGYEGVLNTLSLFYRHEADKWWKEFQQTGENGARVCSQMDEERANGLYDALEERGYFDR